MEIDGGASGAASGAAASSAAGDATTEFAATEFAGEDAVSVHSEDSPPSEIETSASSRRSSTKSERIRGSGRKLKRLQRAAAHYASQGKEFIPSA
jgi:hypothetical protein